MYPGVVPILGLYVCTAQCCLQWLNACSHWRGHRPWQTAADVCVQENSEHTSVMLRAVQVLHGQTPMAAGHPTGVEIKFGYMKYWRLVGGVVLGYHAMR